MSLESSDRVCALVLGGHVNGYSIINELHSCGIKNIALFDSGKSLARRSNKIIYQATIDKSREALLHELNNLNRRFDYIVVFPTNDVQIKNLYLLYDQVSSFCYLPFNRHTVLNSLDKFFQYKTCDLIGVPYPKTAHASKVEDLDVVDKLTFPLLVKPTVRWDLTTDVFRTLYLSSYEQFERYHSRILKNIEGGVEFAISEYIPGDDTNIYAYTCFRTEDGRILNEWTGKKLNQYPDNYGVFSSASNEAAKVVLEQGRVLVNALDASGIVQPEFKYDHRNGTFKLMEVNLRSMMWHRVGSISGVKLQETQFKHATNQKITSYHQDKSKRIHLVLMLHEIPNLISRRGYWKHFKHNVWGGEKRVWAVFDSGDFKPFLVSLALLLKVGVSACLKRFKLR